MRKRLVSAAVVALCLLPGCARTVPGTVAMTTEPLAVNTLTCREFTDLEKAEQAEVVKELLDGQDSAFGTNQPLAVMALADVMCDYLPEVPLRDVLLGPG